MTAPLERGEWIFLDPPATCQNRRRQMPDRHREEAEHRSDRPDPIEEPAESSSGEQHRAAEEALPLFKAVTEASRRLRDQTTTDRFEQITRVAEEHLERLRALHQRGRAGGERGPDLRRAHPARVLLVDDQELAREALRSVLGREPDLWVVGEAAGGREAVAKARDLGPDLVLMDVRMPGGDGLAATREIVQASPDTRVVLVTTYDDREYVVEGLRSGARGYVLKDATKQELLATLRAVLAGAVSIHGPGVGPGLEQAMAADRPAPHGLSEREVDVLRLLARGLTNYGIAVRLHLTVNTVKTHVRHILRKLDAPDRAAAVAKAAALGLLSEE